MPGFSRRLFAIRCNESEIILETDRRKQVTEEKKEALAAIEARKELISKSGSPTPRDIASGISLTRSKNFRIPDGSMPVIFLDNGFLIMVLQASFLFFSVRT